MGFILDSTELIMEDLDDRVRVRVRVRSTELIMEDLDDTD